MTDEFDNPEAGTEKPSKSQIKRDMQVLTELGAQLVDLPAQTLNKLELPAALHAAIRECRSITRHGGRKRQLKYIGKLMRDVDADAIRQTLEQLSAPQRAEVQHFHLLEQWRERLLNEGDSALTELLDQHPSADHQQLRQLLRNARNEKLPETRRKQAVREIFRHLRELFDH